MNKKYPASKHNMNDGLPSSQTKNVEHSEEYMSPGAMSSCSDDGTSNTTSPAGKQVQQQQQHVRAWSGSFAEMATEVFGKSVPPPPKPPTVPRRRSVDEERQTFHDRNRKFLDQAEKERSRLLQPPQSLPMSTPSPRGKTHKRLASIEEISTEESTSTEKLLMAKQKQVGQHHVRSGSYGGSYGSGGSDDDYSSTSNGSFSSFSSWFSRGESGQLSKGQLERMLQFEQRQQEQFDETKNDIGEKLSAALDSKIPSDKEKEKFVQRYVEELEKERESLMEQWKAELKAERQAMDPPLSITLYKTLVEPCADSVATCLAVLEQFIANLPLTIGAVGLSWVTMGTVWWKYMEEMAGFCIPVHFNSDQCTFPEYPGCFDCDTSQPLYQFTLQFHYCCSLFAGVCCLLFVLKVLVAWEIVVDELSNPTTATPLGVVCIATICVFAGSSNIFAHAIVLITSTFHLVFACWFLYVAIFRFGLFPDPGWFPPTVGITYAAVKSWLYVPQFALVLLFCSVVFFFGTFFVSVVRVVTNKRIAAPVAWIGLSAPSITLYALTLVAQPTPLQQKLLDQDPEFQLHNHEWLVKYYLPFQHFMMFLCLIGLTSAVHGLATRWESFRTKPFSPAHVAFCFPTLSHTNAIQAYRGAVNAFSTFAPGGPFKVALYWYWVTFLVGGSILNIIFTYKFICRLPQWTKLDTAGEEEPPAREITFIHEMLDGSGVHELVFSQPFTNPAVLEANEAGALMRVRRGTEDYRLHGPYVRTRKVTAYGFDPIMDDEQLRRERAELLDWVAKNAPRKRNRTMSNPVILRARGYQDAIPNDLVYGTFDHHHHNHNNDNNNNNNPPLGHQRSATTSRLPGV